VRQAQDRRGKPVGAPGPVVLEQASANQRLRQPAYRGARKAGAFGQFPIAQQVRPWSERPQDLDTALK